MGKEVIVRIREHGFKGHGSFEYKNKINLNDSKQLALLLLDFERYGADIEKSLKAFRNEKSLLGFPF